jgi:hypothetical protein
MSGAMRSREASPGRRGQDRRAERRLRPHLVALVSLAMVLLLSVGCTSTATTSRGTGELTSPGQYGGAYAGGTATGDTQAGAAFAQWVLEQDPRREYMTDAVVRGEETLGVKVQPQVTRADVQRLLVALTEGMARTFPGKPLKVIAFYQSGDRLAEANYDPRTGRVDVQFAQ